MCSEEKAAEATPQTSSVQTQALRGTALELKLAYGKELVGDRRARWRGPGRDGGTQTDQHVPVLSTAIRPEMRKPFPRRQLLAKLQDRRGAPVNLVPHTSKYILRMLHTTHIRQGLRNVD